MKKQKGFEIKKYNWSKISVQILISIFFVVLTILVSPNSVISGLVCFSAITSSYFAFDLKSEQLTLFPVFLWLAFLFGGFLSGIIVYLSLIIAALWFNLKPAKIFTFFLKYIPLVILFFFTLSTGTGLKAFYLLLIPSGIIIQVLTGTISLKSLKIVSITWLLYGIFSWIIHFFLTGSGIVGGVMIITAIFTSLVMNYKTKLQLNSISQRIELLSLQNKFVSYLYDKNADFQLYLMNGSEVWTMQGKPASINISQPKSRNYEIVRQGKWLLVSTKKSTFIAEGKAASELETLSKTDLMETLDLLENIWTASFRKKRLENAFMGAALMFVQLADKRDSDTHNHSVRVSTMAVRLAKILKLPESEILQLRVGALLHDIGKLAIPAHLIMKKGLLTQKERTLIETHPEAGGKLLGEIQRYDETITIVNQHHEHIDGTGYPLGLKGSSISLLARIVAVADVFDAITSPRSYHLGISEKSAFQEINKYRGIHFDANVVDALKDLIL